MENVTITFEQDGKKAIGKMTVEDDKITLNLDFEPGLEPKNLDKPAPAYLKLAFAFIKFLKKGI